MSTLFIAISGASGSGKTQFAEAIVKEIQEEISPESISILHEDAYYNDQSHRTMEEREMQNYDHPDAYDHDLLLQHLQALKQGQSVASPTYDFAAHNRAQKVRQVAPARVFIVEGILLLHKQDLSDFFDIRIFIDTPLDICLSRRLRRDMNERGRTFESVMTQYESTVRPMFKQFIEPSRHSAHAILPMSAPNEEAIRLLKARIASFL